MFTPAVLRFVTGLALTTSCSAFAVEREPVQTPPILPPATRYSGGTPIEINNGVSWDNGTFGAPNPDYEAWAKTPTLVAGLSDRPYSFTQKAQFVDVLQEQVIWGESAIRNWKATTGEFPDAQTYAKGALDKMQPAFEALKSATSKASGANEGAWTGAEQDARKALTDWRIAYMGMHKNVQVRQLTK